MPIKKVLLLAGASLAIICSACTPVQSDKPLGSEPAQFTEESRLDGLWTDETSFYFVRTDGSDGSILRVTRVDVDEDKSVSVGFPVVVRQVNRDGEQWLLFSEEDTKLRGRYAWALGSRRGTDQILMRFTGAHSRVFEDLVRAGVLPGVVLDVPQRGQSNFAGPVNIHVLLENLSDRDVETIIDRREKLFNHDPLVFTRLRRLR